MKSKLFLATVFLSVSFWLQAQSPAAKLLKKYEAKEGVSVITQSSPITDSTNKKVKSFSTKILTMELDEENSTSKKLFQNVVKDCKKVMQSYTIINSIKEDDFVTKTGQLMNDGMMENVTLVIDEGSVTLTVMQAEKTK